MNDPASADPHANFPGQRAAVRLGAALLIGLGLVLALVLRDNARRSTLESIVESSAVGDTRYLPIPDPLPAEPFPAVAHFGGKPLVPAGYKRHEKREADMQAVGTDMATGLTIYRAPVKAKEASDPPTYFLKVGPGEFVKVRVGMNNDG
jgi:hypothetical protein